LKYTIDEDGTVKAIKNTNLTIDEAKIKEEAKYDGYYMIVSSELEFSDEKIIKSYHELWKIEETFKITKSDLETRPIYHQKDDRIEAHFLMCYISIVILRLLQYKTGNKYSCSKLIEELNSINCSYCEGNTYLFNYRSTITDELNSIFDLEFGKKWMSKKEINDSYSKLRK
jgi:transposase